jgi:hypothetical protein
VDGREDGAIGDDDDDDGAIDDGGVDGVFVFDDDDDDGGRGVWTRGTIGRRKIITRRR